MQTINVFRSDAVENANAIKDVFDQYATGYFSSVTVDTTTESGTAVYVNFYMDGSETPAMRFRIANSTTGSGNVHRVYIGDFEVGCTNDNNYNYRFYNINITDNALVVHTGPNENQSISKEYLFVLCKNKQGSPMISFVTGSSTYTTSLTIYGCSSNATTNYVANISIPDGNVTVYTQYISINSNNTVIGVPAMHQDGESSNVWVAANKCFYSIRNPFTYTIGDESYAGIGYNTYIIKTN